MVKESKKINDLNNPNHIEYKKNIEGWVCTICHRFWNKDKRMAQYCCAEHNMCNCGELTSKGWMICDKCRIDKDRERFEKAERAEWDGEIPLVEWENDKYFFDIEDIIHYLEENDIKIEDVELEICEKQTLPIFDINEFLYDHLPEDNSVDDYKRIDEDINSIIKDSVSDVWIGSGKVPTIESLKHYLDT